MESFVTYSRFEPKCNGTYLRAMKHGQMLLGVTHVDELLRQWIMAIVDIVPESDIHIYLVGDADNPILRAFTQAQDKRIHLIHQIVTDEMVDLVLNQDEVFVQDRYDEQSSRGLYLPIINQKTNLGVVHIDEVATIDESIESVIKTLDILIAFGAAALQNCHKLQMNKFFSLNDQIEHRRLAAISELAAAVAHQLNNPLTTILADTELLLLDSEAKSQKKQSLLAIFRAGRRAAEVVNRLLSVSQPNKMEGMPQPFNILQTIEDALELIRNYIQSERIQIIQKSDENIPPIWVVPGVLEIVWMNLLMNARDSLVGKNDAILGIEVYYHETSNVIDVVIWDNGSGISKDKQDIVFEPFYTTKPATERIGLGLHISKQIVRRIGGDIFLNEHESGGACFTVRLPLKRGF